MVVSAAYLSICIKTTSVFKHFNVSSAGFYVNGESTPRQSLDPDFTDSGYLLVLLSLCRVFDTLNEKQRYWYDMK